MSTLQLRTGGLALIPSSEAAVAYSFTAGGDGDSEGSMSSRLIDTPEAVFVGLAQLLQRAQADEFMMPTRMHSYEADVCSLTLVADSAS